VVPSSHSDQGSDSALGANFFGHRAGLSMIRRVGPAALLGAVVPRAPFGATLNMCLVGLFLVVQQVSLLPQPATGTLSLMHGQLSIPAENDHRLFGNRETLILPM